LVIGIYDLHAFLKGISGSIFDIFDGLRNYQKVVFVVYFALCATFCAKHYAHLYEQF